MALFGGKSIGPQPSPGQISRLLCHQSNGNVEFSETLGKCVQENGSLANASRLSLKRQARRSPPRGERARGGGLLLNFNFCPVLSNR